MDVLAAAHAHHVRTDDPEPADRPVDRPVADGGARCGRCGTQDPRRAYDRATAVISPNFTAADQWLHPTSPWLCSTCVWGYRTPALRLHPHLVHRAPVSGTVLDIATACQLLLARSLSPDSALTVPLKPGRKHLLPAARWGLVTTDDAHLPWSSADASRLHTTLRLRRHGFGTRMLADPAPAWAVLRRLPTPHQAQVLADWPQLDVWRARRPWLALALHLTANTHLETR